MALEILHLTTEGEFWEAQCAIDGTLAVPFLFHKAVADEFPTEREFHNFLERNSRALIDQFGDARKWPEQGHKEVELGEA